MSAIDINAPVAAASALNRRLSRDISTAIDGARDAGVLQSTRVRALDPRRLPSGITKRQAEVLAELASGATNAEICRKLHISARTLENHISHIGDRFNGRGRGRHGVLEGARAVQAIVAVPAILISAALADGIVAIQDML